MLLVQDTTEVDLSPHPKTKGLGQVGNERGRGLYLQTVLAVLPQSGEVLGCAMQEPFVRTRAPAAETRSKPRQRTERETAVWMRLVTRLGSFPPETTIVHVGDRGAALFPFFQACRAMHTHFLVRAFENRGTLARRGRTQVSARFCAHLACTSQPTVPGASQPWTNGPLDGGAARLWPLDRVGTSRRSSGSAKNRWKSGPFGCGKSRHLLEKSPWKGCC